MGSRTETDKSLPRLAPATPVLKQVLPQGAGSTLRCWVVHDKMPIGREVDPDVGICLPDDDKVSKQHAMLRCHGDEIEIVDQGSKNHIFVDGQQVCQAALKDGSVLRIGNALFVMRVEKALGPDAPRRAATLHQRLCGPSKELRELRHQLSQAASSVEPLLLIGPTGTGKELAAEAVHELSPRSSRPLVCVNCAAIPAGTAESALFGHRRGSFTGADRDQDGYFRQADGGTLLLDEIGELPLDLQAKLLRVLQPPWSANIAPAGRYFIRFRPLGHPSDVEVDVRLIAATHVDLDHACQAGRFRTDLHQRLAVIPVRFPALSARLEDVLWLLHHYLNRENENGPRRQVSAQLGEQFLLYAWPGNVREVVNLSKRLLFLFPSEQTIDLAGIPDDLLARLATQRRSVAAPLPTSTPAPPKESAEAPLTGERLTRLLQENNGSISGVARLLDRSPRQIRRRMEQFGLRAAAKAGTKEKL